MSVRLAVGEAEDDQKFLERWVQIRVDVVWSKSRGFWGVKTS